MRTQPRGPNEADFVFRDGAVFTADPKRRWAKAVAVRDGIITHVGDVAEVEDLIGRGTRVIDLEGRLLLPGFVEGQSHPILGAALTQGVNVQFQTREETLAALAAWRDQAGRVDMVRGYGWHYSAFGLYGPSKTDLDALWPDTPVVLLSIDMRAAWTNSTALKRANIVRGVPDPLPGLSFFQREARTGEPTGYVIGTPAVLQLLQGATPVSSTMISAALGNWLPRAAAEGITSLFDSGVHIMADKDALALYEKFEREKRLPCRIVACYDYNNPSVDPMPLVRRLRDRSRTELVRAGVLKIVLDGTDTHFSAALEAPYADRPRVRGELIINPGLVRDTVMRADAEGFDVVFHAAGDRAVRIALDAIEAAMKGNGKRSRRHTIAYLSSIAPEDIQRFADLGVIAQFSAQCAVPDAHWEQITMPRLGPQRAANTFPMASLLHAGATLAFGTDWSMVPHRPTFRPLDAIEVAVTRRQIGHPDGKSLPPASEALTIEQAVIANTLGAARQLRLDTRVGSITPGKRADLVMLDRNIFEMPPHQIHDAKVSMTLMNGIVRHEASTSLSLPTPLPKSLPSATAPVSLGRDGG
ncbi:MAG: amidohydrolase [Proteobacteria bacterium]|nr:amidohydrolase [Pseudomonadota bacterium]